MLNTREATTSSAYVQGNVASQILDDEALQLPCQVFQPVRPTGESILTLRCGDPEFDKKLLAAPDCVTLRIKGMAAGVRIRHWLDGKGFFFWFEHGHDRNSAHYYPQVLKTIEVNAQSVDIDLEKFWTIDAFLTKHNRLLGGFMSMDHKTDLKQALSYYYRLSQMPESELCLLEQILRENALVSGNPYFRILLADILVAAVIQPAMREIFRGRHVCLASPDTTSYLDTALEQVHLAERQSFECLRALGELPNEGIFQALNVHAYRLDQSMFWAGCHYQARRRLSVLSQLVDYLPSGALEGFLANTEHLLRLTDHNKVAV